MNLPWWGWVAFVTMLVVGPVFVMAPAIGAWWARDFRPTHCPTCRRELIGSPPVHMLDDRMYCRLMSASREDVL
jgi:hypothetical protein